MTTQPAVLHEDQNGRVTSAQYADDGSGSSGWFIPVRLRALEKAEDVAHTSGDAGVMALAVRKDTPAALAGTDGDYSPLLTNVNGRLWVAGAHREDDAAASGDTGVHLLGVRRDALASSAGTDGDYSSVGLDAFGRLDVRQRPVSGDTTGWSRAKNAGALAASLVVKNSAGRLRLVRVTSTLASLQFLQVHNATALPSNGVTPEHVVAIPASSSVVLDLGELGDYLSTGIVLTNSTTAATLTIGAGDCVFSALYI